MDLDGGIGLAGPRGLDRRRFSHEAMNTVFEVHLANADPRYAAEAAQAAFALVDRLEGELSRFRPNSDITRINHLAAGESVRVGEAALECLVIARHLYDVTGGAFDIAIGTGLPALEGSGTDAALIQYTSGSTGRPKGVLLTHANLLANIKAIAAGLGLRPTDVGVSWLPLYHDMGLIGSWLFCLYHGIPIDIQSPLAFLARRGRGKRLQPSGRPGHPTR